MKNATKKLIIVLLVPALAVLALCACSKTAEREFDLVVTFDYNMPESSEANIENQYLGLNVGDRIYVKPGDAKAAGWLDERPIRGYYVDGWFLPRTDEAGEPIVNEDGTVELGEAWDFGSGTVTGDVTLYARIRPNAKLRVLLPGGDVVTEYDGKPGSTMRRPERGDLSAPTIEGKTFYGFYSDEELSVPYDWGESGRYTFGAEDETVYAKFIDGEWRIISTTDEFTRYVSGENVKLYIDADLDFTEVTVRGDLGWSLDGEINGNGYSIIGVKREFTWARRTSAGLALFSSVSARSYIHDLNVIDAEVSISFGMETPPGVNVALFVDEVANGARFERLTVTGTLNVGKVSSTGQPPTCFPFAANDKRAEKDDATNDFGGISVVDANNAA